MNADGLLDGGCRRLTAEQSAICRSPAGEKQVCSERERSSQPCFPPADAPGARRFRLTSPRPGRGIRPKSKSRREWRGLRFERRPLGHTPVTIAGDRNWSMSQRSPAVVRRRPGPRYVLESRMRPSAFICVICGFSVGGLCALCVFTVQKFLGGNSKLRIKN